MKTKTLMLAIAICFAAQGVWAEQMDEDDHTAFLLCDKGAAQVPNGRAWKKMSVPQQAGLVMGIHYGMLLMANEMSYNESVTSERILNAINRLNTPGAWDSETIASVTEFYKDSTNLRLPVVEAYRFVKMKAVGATPEELGRHLAHLRKFYNQAVKP